MVRRRLLLSERVGIALAGVLGVLYVAGLFRAADWLGEDPKRWIIALAVVAAVLVVWLVIGITGVLAALLVR